MLSSAMFTLLVITASRRILSNIGSISNRKYQSAYYRARFAFAPLVSISFGQTEGDFLRFLFKCAHNTAWTSVGLGNIEPDYREPISQHDMEELMEAYKALRGLLFQQYRSRMLLTIA